MALYKALKHKQLVHTYGQFLRDFNNEIFYSNIPRLLPYNTTMDMLRENLEKSPNALKNLGDYELIDVEVKEMQ